MKHSVILGSSCVFSIAAATAYNSDELWSRAATQNIKLKDLEDYGDFRILPRTPATTRSQNRAQEEAVRGGGNQNLGVVRGGVNAGRGRAAGNVGRAGGAAGVANRGRGGWQDPGSYAQEFASDRGFPMRPIVGGPNPRALQPITAAASRARGQAVPRGLPNIRGMAQHPNIRRPTGQQWVTRDAADNASFIFPQPATRTAIGFAEVTNGEGYFHSAHGSHRGAAAESRWKSSERQTPILNAGRGNRAHLHAWNTHAVKTGITITSTNDPQTWAGEMKAVANHHVRTMIRLPHGSSAVLGVVQGDLVRTDQHFHGPTDTFVITQHPVRAGFQYKLLHATKLRGRGSIVSMAYTKAHTLRRDPLALPLGVWGGPPGQVGADAAVVPPQEPPPELPDIPDPQVPPVIPA